MTVSAQNITNTLGTGGDYIIRDAANLYLTFKQSTGLMGLGAGVITPRTQLEIGGTEGLLVTGTYTSGTPLNLGAGTRLHWYPKKAAFRAGGIEGNQWDDDSIGIYSAAMGYNTRAFGDFSTAMGYNTQASGYSSTAMGLQTNASGYSSTAMGFVTQAFGDFSTAMGYQTQASGYYSTAMGYGTEALGNYSTAMGNFTLASGNFSIAMGIQDTASGIVSVAIGTKANTQNHTGAMVFTDYSGNSVTTSADADNQLTMRFTGGYRFFTNIIHTTGAYMDPGTSGWTNYCDRNKKENFKAIDNEDLLYKLRGIPVTRWNYKGNPNIDYIGPMAQDFYAVFHLGGEDSLGINSICIDGVTLAGVKALEERTRIMKSEIDSLTTENRQIKTAFSVIQTEVKNLTGENNKIRHENHQLSGRIDQLARDNQELKNQIDRDNRELKAQLARVTEALDRLTAREETTEPASPSASAVSPLSGHPEQVTTILP